MIIFALSVALVLGQEADPAAAPAAPAAPAEAPPAATPSGDAPPPEKRTGSVNVRKVDPEELQRELQRIQRMGTGIENSEAIKDLQRRLPHLGDTASDNPVPEVNNFGSLSEAEQAKYIARDFYQAMLAGDARKVVLSCAYPFQLEDRKLASPDELFAELLKNLRSKRTDLLTLYDVEVLTPNDMEKKYGQPPKRLASLQWHGAHTWLAVGNVSGHGAVAVLKLDGAKWSVVGYHD